MNLRAFRNRILPACLVPIAIAVMSAPGDREPPGQTSRESATPRATLPVVRTPRAMPTRLAKPTLRVAPPAVAGMVVGIDPETGEVGLPSAEQRAAINAAHPPIARVTRDGFTEIRTASGAVGIDLGGRLQDFAVVQSGPDGKPMFGCVRPVGAVPARPDSLATPLEER